MGRSMPSGDDLMIHPALSFPLLVAGMTATMAIITGICGFRRRRRRRRRSPPDPSSPKVGWTERADSDVATREATIGSPTTEDEAEASVQLPPPPALRDLRATYSCNYKSEPERTRTMSVKVPRSMSSIRYQDDKRHKGKKATQRTLKSDDNAVWTKTIILGGKCRIRGGEDDVVFHGKGTNASTPNPVPSALPLSRQTSSIDPHAISGQDKQKGNKYEN